MIHARTCNICEALCGVLVEHDGERVVSIRGNPDDAFSRGHVCPKATALADLHEDPDRLRQPMRRQGDSWIPVPWESALDEAASRLHEVRKQHGRNAIAVYAGNPTAHSYSALLGALVLHQVLRTKSRFSATSVDQLPHMFAALQMFGHQLLLPVPDIDRTRHMMIIGANPAVSNGSLMTAPGVVKSIKDIRARGGRVIVVDPRRTETAELADEHHFVRPGTDALLLAAMVDALFSERLVSQGPWRKYTRGLDELQRFAARFPAERVADAVGIDAPTIRRFSRELAAASSGVVYSRLGACVQEFGGVAAWLTIALNVITGNLDRPGGAMFGTPAVDLVKVAGLAGQKGHFDIWRSRVSGLPEFGGELPVSTLAEEIETPGEGQIRALITIAGNPVMSTPNADRLSSAIGSLDFYVALDMYITGTSRHANLILPPLSPLERDHYGLALQALGVRNATKYSTPTFAPPADAHDDWATLLGLAERLNRLDGGLKKRAGSVAIRRLAEAGPRGLLDVLIKAGPYGLRNPRGPRLSLRRLEETPGGFDLGPLRPCLPGRLATEDGELHLAPTVLLDDAHRLEQALGRRPERGELLLIGRRNLRSNNSWLHNSERMARGRKRTALLMHPDDAAARGVADGDAVSVRSRVGEVEVELAVDEAMMPGVVSLPHGWGHAEFGARLRVANAAGGANVNLLTDEKRVDELTGNSVLNGVPVSVTRVAAAAE